MMKKLLAPLTLGLLFTLPAAAAPDDEDLQALREELNRAREELADASRKLERFAEREGITLRDRRSFQFSFSDERPMLGIILSAAERGRGVKLSGVTPGAPAAKAGLRSGDLLLSIDGKSLEGPDAVDRAYDLLEDMKQGDRFLFRYRRDGEEAEVELEAALHQPSYSFSFNDPDIRFLGPDGPIRFGELDLEALKAWTESRRDWEFDFRGLKDLPGLDVRPWAWQLGWAWSGLELAALNPDLGRYFGTDSGVLVIQAEGLDDSDLKAGDVIRSINGLAVTSPREAMQRLRKLEPGETATARVRRDGSERDITIVAPEPSDEGVFGYSWSWSDEEEA